MKLNVLGIIISKEMNNVLKSNLSWTSFSQFFIQYLYQSSECWSIVKMARYHHWISANTDTHQILFSLKANIIVDIIKYKV